MSAQPHATSIPTDSAAGPQSAAYAGNGSQTVKMSRTIHINISGSLGNLALAGPTGGTWKLVDGQQLGAFGAGGEVDSQVATNQLRTALVTRVVFIQERSTFPVPLGVKINCVPPTEITEHGEKFAFTVLPLSTNNSERVIYQCDASSEDGLQWRKDYPKWNSSNLETEGVLNVENNPWVFVHQDHPIIALLRHNAQLIGCRIDDQPKIDQEWYKVTRQVLNACCQTLRAKVLKHVTSNDLNLFQVQAKRLNAESWDDMSDLQTVLHTGATPGSDDAAKFLSTPYSYMARVQIEYEVQSVA